jgi:hypothetical protein
MKSNAINDANTFKHRPIANSDTGSNHPLYYHR